MGNVGEDIVLLAVKRNGTVAAYEKLCFALASSELVRLAQTRHIEFDGNGAIVVLDASPTGDVLIDLALARLIARTPRPTAAQWVAGQHPILVNGYLGHLTVAGTIRFEERTILGLLRIQRWIVLDPARVKDAKDRLDAIVSTTGTLSTEQATFAALVHTVGLGSLLYPKRKGRVARGRLAAIAAQHESVRTVKGARNSAKSAADTSAGTNTVLQVGLWTAVETSINATLRAVAQHHRTGQYHQTGQGGNVHHGAGSGHGGGFHHDGGGMAGGHHG